MATWSLVDDNFGLELITPNEDSRKYTLKIMGTEICSSHSKAEMQRLIQLLVMSSAEMWQLLRRMDTDGSGKLFFADNPEGWVRKK